MWVFLVSNRVVFDMADKRCYRGLIPTTQSQRLSSPLAGGVQQLSRWAHSDAQESYDDICWADVEEGQQNVASNKDEL